MNKLEALAERREENRRGRPISAAKAQELLTEYLAGGTSYRKLAAKHKLGVGTVVRAVGRAAEAQP